MPRDPRAYLWDVREAVSDIQGFVAGLDLSAYVASALVHSAVERKFEIIGEALNQLAKLDPMLAARIPRLPEIVAFRNQLIHGYAAIAHERVWATIQTALPTLAETVQALLTELGEE
jgi:uncharacterized protein with HEPN domain